MPVVIAAPVIVKNEAKPVPVRQKTGAEQARERELIAAEGVHAAHDEYLLIRYISERRIAAEKQKLEIERKAEEDAKRAKKAAAEAKAQAFMKCGCSIDACSAHCCRKMKI